MALLIVINANLIYARSGLVTAVQSFLIMTRSKRPQDNCSLGTVIRLQDSNLDDVGIKWNQDYFARVAATNVDPDQQIRSGSALVTNKKRD